MRNFVAGCVDAERYLAEREARLVEVPSLVRYCECRAEHLAPLLRELEARKSGARPGDSDWATLFKKANEQCSRKILQPQ